MPDLLLRLRLPSGLQSLSLPSSAPLCELQARIAELSSISASEQELRTGYPPVPLLTAGRESASLEELGFKRGDQILLARLAPASSSPAPSPASASPAFTRNAAPAPRRGGKVESESEPVNDGHLVLRVVPDDNSCLFASVAILLEGGASAAQKLRQVVADTIRADPVTYSEAMLGREPASYIKTILTPSSWGGAIELSILSHAYKTSLVSVDVASGRVDSYNAGEYEGRGVVVYSGIHYDALTFSPLPDAPPEFHTTVFPTPSSSSPSTPDPILDAARAIARRLKERHYYTDTATFTLKCQDCGAGLTGEKEAREHAGRTGHVRFGEY